MSKEVYDDIHCPKNGVAKEKYNYRKCSIGTEVSKCFPGCVIYVQAFYMAMKHGYWRIPGYCSHLNCRNYKLVANLSNPRVFTVFVDHPEVAHVRPISRQVRQYDRQVMEDELQKELPNTYVARLVNKTSKELIAAGSYGVIVSQHVAEKVRSKATQRQDSETDDYSDLEALQGETNYVSKILPRKNFATYIHSPNQMNALAKLHEKRDADGVPLIGRLDATGGIARPLNPGDKLLYYALTTNVKVSYDKHSTPLPTSEQYNIRHTSQDIAAWLFNFISSYFAINSNPPLLFDYMTSDFSFANFHAILLAFNRLSLSQYLKMCYDWVQHKLDFEKFPVSFDQVTKIVMC